LSSWPARPTKGSPRRSSSAPGASPMTSHSARRLPTPKTPWVRVAWRPHFVQLSTSAVRARHWESVSGGTGVPAARPGLMTGMRARASAAPAARCGNVGAGGTAGSDAAEGDAAKDAPAEDGVLFARVAGDAGGALHPATSAAPADEAVPAEARAGCAVVEGDASGEAARRAGAASSASGSTSGGTSGSTAGGAAIGGGGRPRRSHPSTPIARRYSRRRARSIRTIRPGRREPRGGYDGQSTAPAPTARRS